jgi:benzoyl-CoA reductase/2-hydroxyglutaryl-CoA dehydratase subunit BcrC/BadD/HgdB
MYELMAESRPMYVLELPHRAEDSDSLEYWFQELQQFREFLAKRFSVDISDDKLREAIRSLNRERALRREIASLMKSDRPALVGRQVLDCKSSIWAMPDALRQYQSILDASRKNHGPSGSIESAGSACSKAFREPNTSGRVRVLMTGVPMVHGAERVLDIIENSGGLVVAAENCTGLKPLMEDVDENAADPLRALAEKYFHLPCSVMTLNNRRLDMLRQLAVEYRAECVIELTWQACLTYDVESHRVKRFVEQELKLPYLHIETDYSPSDSARIAMRVEALLETVRGRQAKTCGCS